MVDAENLDCSLRCDRLSRRRPRPLNFECIDQPSEESNPWIVNSATYLQFNERSGIFRAVLRGHRDGVKSVALKVGPLSVLRQEKFLREASAYSTACRETSSGQGHTSSVLWILFTGYWSPFCHLPVLGLRRLRQASENLFQIHRLEHQVRSFMQSLYQTTDLVYRADSYFRCMSLACTEFGALHGDICERNVAIEPDGKPVLIGIEDIYNPARFKCCFPTTFASPAPLRGISSSLSRLSTGLKYYTPVQ